MPPGDLFAFSYWHVLTRRYPALTWNEFLEWDLWQVAAGLGLDRVDPSDEDQELLTRFQTEGRRAPSPNRRG